MNRVLIPESLPAGAHCGGGQYIRTTINSAKGKEMLRSMRPDCLVVESKRSSVSDGVAANLVRRGDDVDADHLLGQHRLGVDAVEPRTQFSVLGQCLKEGGGKRRSVLFALFCKNRWEK